MKRYYFLVLAAGLSRRYGKAGENKLFEKINGKPMYCHVLDLLFHVKEISPFVEEIVIVTRKEMLGKDPQLGARGLCVINENSEDGISSSVRLAVKAAKSLEDRKPFEDDAWQMVFFVADQPYLTKETLLDFFAAYEMSDKHLASLMCNDRLGNPCIFSAEYYKELAELSGDKGGKQVIFKHMDDTYFHRIERERELLDIDTKENLKE